MWDNTRSLFPFIGETFWGNGWIHGTSATPLIHPSLPSSLVFTADDTNNADSRIFPSSRTKDNTAHTRRFITHTHNHPHFPHFPPPHALPTPCPPPPQQMARGRLRKIGPQTNTRLSKTPKKPSLHPCSTLLLSTPPRPRPPGASSRLRDGQFPPRRKRQHRRPLRHVSSIIGWAFGISASTPIQPTTPVPCTRVRLRAKKQNTGNGPGPEKLHTQERRVLVAAPTHALSADGRVRCQREKSANSGGRRRVCRRCNSLLRLLFGKKKNKKKGRTRSAPSAATIVLFSTLLRCVVKG